MAYGPGTNVQNEKNYLNSLVAQGGGNAAWAQNQLNELNAYAAANPPAPAQSAPKPSASSGMSASQSAPAGSVYVPVLGGPGSVDAYTGLTNNQGNQIIYDKVPDTGRYERDAQGNMWYILNGTAYNMSAGVASPGSSGQVWDQSELDKMKYGDAGYAGAPGSYDLTPYNTGSNSVLDQLRAAQAAAEAAAARARDYNLQLIDQQLAGLNNQDAALRGQIYQDSRLKAVQNAEYQAAMGLGGNPYADAPSGYADSVALKQDAAMRNQLQGVSQQTMDAQRALENMRTNAAVLGEQDINKVTSDWASQIANMMYQQERDAANDAYRQWQMTQTEKQSQLAQQQQQWDNQFRQQAFEYGKSQDETERLLQNAKIQAQYGFYDGYKAVGFSDAAIEQMKIEKARADAMEAQALAARYSSGSGGSASDGRIAGMTYSQAYNAAMSELEFTNGSIITPALKAEFQYLEDAFREKYGLGGNTLMSGAPTVSAGSGGPRFSTNVAGQSSLDQTVQNLIYAGYTDDQINDILYRMGISRG